MSDSNVGIYAIRNTLTGDYYVGSSTNIGHRWSVHRSYLRHDSHHSPILQHAWNKYGEDAFVFEVVEVCEREELVEREQEYLDYQKGRYNIAGDANGSMNGHVWTPEQRQRLSEAVTGKPKPWLQGRKRTFTPEWIENMRQAALRRATPGHTTPHSEESKAKMSAAKMGNRCASGKRTPEQCDRIRQGQLRRYSEAT